MDARVSEDPVRDVRNASHRVVKEALARAADPRSPVLPSGGSTGASADTFDAPSGGSPGGVADVTGGSSAAPDGRRAWGVDNALNAVPAGLPVAPVPGYWYATTNVWTVRVRGAYARFSLRTRRGSPGESLRYVRDGSTVRLDVNGDGERERLGYDE